MNPAALLALISELYERIAALTDENRRLRQDLEAKADTAETPGT